MAFQKAHSGFISLLKSVSVLYSFLVDILYFKASFDAMSICGALTIFVFLTTSVYLRMSQQKDLPSVIPSSATEKKDALIVKDVRDGEKDEEG
mmetsp:Transcript_1274/g.1525  ORF Transcript_1274/g.1525 Transcript_1274/m.1525 type:complete len:93 (-) Transcript_1274:26-304(-)